MKGIYRPATEHARKLRNISACDSIVTERVIYCARKQEMNNPVYEINKKNYFKKEIKTMSEIINEKELNEVSGGTAAGPSWTQNGMTFYRIVFGDTLSEIAARFHTSCYAIQALNPTLIKDINVIKAGWEIRVL